MRTDDFFDLLGEVDDKYYVEVMCEGPEEVAPVAAGKRGFPFMRLAASLAVIIGLAAAGAALLRGSGLITSREQENGTEQFGSDIIEITGIDGEKPNTSHSIAVTDLNRSVSPTINLIKPTEEQIRESVSYVMENQNRTGGDNGIANNVYGTMTVDDLSCYTIDLDFDNTEEIIVVSWALSDMFIFELNGNNAVFNSTVEKNNIDFIITEKNFTRLCPYYDESIENTYFPGDGECYYHFFYEADNGTDEHRITAAAIRQDKDTGKYRAAKLMEYGFEGADNGKPRFSFSVTDEISASEGMTEEEFRELWSRHAALPAIVITKDIDYCKNYVADNYDILLPPDKRGYFSEVTAEELSCYIKDLNYDGTNEIVIVSWEHSPLFIFDHNYFDDPDSFSFRSIIGRDKIRSYITEETFSTLTPIFDGEDRYSCYYYETDYAYSDISRNMSAIKCNNGDYYVEHCLSYDRECVNGKDWTAFFRKGIGPDTEELSYEEFAALWNKYENLPPVSFVDINKEILKWYENEKHQAIFDFDGFDTYGYDFYAAGDSYIIDAEGNITSIDGSTEWETENDPIARAMAKLARGDMDDLNYLGDVEYYHYGDFVSISNGKAYLYADTELSEHLLIMGNPDTERPEVFSTALLTPCKGYKYHYEDYPAFDVNEIPDVQEAEEYANRWRWFTEEQKALYAAVYPCYSNAVLYSEEKYGYRFEIIAEELYKDTAAGEDKVYYNNYIYTRITKLSDPNIITIDYNSPLIGNSYFPLQENYEEYALRVYELNDGIVMFCPSTDTGGTLTPFTTIVENEDGSIEIGYLYGDFSDIMLDMGHILEGWRQLDVNARFTADYENNTLYYGDTAFVFDFSKVGMGYDYEANRFVPCFTSHKIID